MAAALVILVVVLFIPVPTGPVSPHQAALDNAITYFGSNYNIRNGLISETPSGSTYWVYSDNYLAALAASRYSTQSSGYSNFARALLEAMYGYVSVLPEALSSNQYTALNSTATSFNCSRDFALGWADSSNGSALGPGQASIKTSANVGSPSCASASDNYADILFLEAVYYHRLGNGSAATHLYALGAADFNGTGVVDKAYTDPASASYHRFQTYKLALYVYSSVCLSQQPGGGALPGAESTLLRQQDNFTGGFATSYTNSGAPQGGVNTETTALAALALELMINPTAPC